jgi:hypothetical protein
MIKWHKHPDDSAMPSKKADKLAWYYDICGWGDPVAPQILGLPIQEDHREIPAPLPLPEPDLDINDVTAVDFDGRDAALDAGEVLLMIAPRVEGV